MLSKLEVALLLALPAFFVLVVAFMTVDVKMASSHHENRVELVSTQYISSAELIKQGRQAHYSDEYVVGFVLENEMQSSRVSPDSFRKINKMKNQKGAMDFLVQYKKTFFTRKIIDVDVVLDSNPQFKNIE